MTPSLTDTSTIPALLAARAANSPTHVAHYELDEQGQWQPSTWHDFYADTRRLAGGLHAAGLRAGHRFGILARTCRDWERVQMAVLHAGGIVVGLDIHSRSDQLDDILRSVPVRFLAVQSISDLEGLDDRIVSRIDRIIILSEELRARPSDKYLSLGDIEKGGDDASLSVPSASNPALIIFTSGTTGRIKAVEYTHYQVCLACRAITRSYPSIDVGSRLICWLPLSNLFQRVVNFCAMRYGATVYFISDPKDLMQYLAAIAPDLLIAVPRFYEKLYQGIQYNVERTSAPARVLFRAAESIGDRYHRRRRAGEWPGLWASLLFRLADSLVLGQFRRRLVGTRLQFMISGSAPMPIWLLERFHAYGLLVLEAYGLSENVIPIALNRPDDFRFGTTGRPLPENDLTFGDDGELRVRGEGVYHGYLGASVDRHPVSEEHFATGDYARLDKGGFLWLSGRKSDVFKTSTGRRVAPAEIEALLRGVPCVEHALVYGRGRQFLTALLVIADVAPNSHDTDLEAVLQTDLRLATQSLPRFLRPAGVLVTQTPFTIEGGELTTNLKLRRSVVEERFGDDFAALYSAIETRALGENELPLVHAI